MNLRPCIDLHEGKVKQIVGSSLSDDRSKLIENYISGHDADYYAELFRQNKLYGGHVILLGPGNEAQALKALHAFPGGLQIGGGITDSNAAFYLEQGASHVIVTSFVFKNGVIDWDNLNTLVAKTGKSRLVLDLSCRKREDGYYIVTDRWQKFTQSKVTPELLASLGVYCDEFLVHAVDVEGKSSGVQTEILEILKASPIPVTYAGGVHTEADIEAVYRAGSGSIHLTIGSALDLYGGKLSFEGMLKKIDELNSVL